MCMEHFANPTLTEKKRMCFNKNILHYDLKISIWFGFCVNISLYYLHIKFIIKIMQMLSVSIVKVVYVKTITGNVCVI
jgi:hypothetical protein